MCDGRCAVYVCLNLGANASSKRQFLLPICSTASLIMAAPAHTQVRTLDESLGKYIVPVPLRDGGWEKGWENQEWNVTGKYRILNYVGSGVYGKVVRARLTSDFSKTVVIKRTSDVFKWGAGFAKYALREIAIMRRLNHPNIVKILDILKPEEGLPPVPFLYNQSFV
jgi:serine/threonine protein kinase